MEVLTECHAVGRVLQAEADRILKNGKRTSNVECNKQKSFHGSIQKKVIPYESKSNVCLNSFYTRKRGQSASR